mgnify:CR=1 FL=1
MIKELDYSIVPKRFGHCLNGNCKRAEKCLRYQVTKFITEDTRYINVLSPQWKLTGKKCTEFLDDTPVKYAYGWNKMFGKLIHEQAVAVKNELLYSFGKNLFYRLKRHERPFTPQAQDFVRKIFQKHGIEEEPEYDFYQYEYKWIKD